MYASANCELQIAASELADERALALVPPRNSDPALLDEAAQTFAFEVDANIIQSLIHEQAGSLRKALAELVMNSVDAGATRVDLTITHDGFTVADDGRGLGSQAEIRQYFGRFGAAHQKGDARFGRFRVGRGQIMSYARTCWRSGVHELRVDVGGNNGSAATYSLATHVDEQPGCIITGQFYRPMSLVEFNYYFSHCGGYFGDIQFIDIPVFLNGIQVNTPPSTVTWDYEDDFAWYRFDDKAGLRIFNLGVFVMDGDRAKAGTGGDIVSKRALKLNMARNAIVSPCPVWCAIHEQLNRRFAVNLARRGKLSSDERRKLLDDILISGRPISRQQVNLIRRARILDDIFGELRTPEEVFDVGPLTIYDGRHPMVAERVQREGLAHVLIPGTFSSYGYRFQGGDWVQAAISVFVERLNFSKQQRFIPFSHFAQTLRDTSRVIEDEKLADDERTGLEALRKVNAQWQSKTSIRRIVAGASDLFLAWTDGASYIAVSTSQLRALRRGSYAAGSLMWLLAHEYAHNDSSSSGGHGHDFEFYRRFHEMVSSPRFAQAACQLMLANIDGMVLSQRIPGGELGSFIDAFVSATSKMRRKRRRAP